MIQDESDDNTESDLQFYEGNKEDLSYFQEDESVIQEDPTESDLQYYEGNKEELESTNELVQKMWDEEMSLDSDGQIQLQVIYKNNWHEKLNFTCRKGRALTHIESVYDETKTDRRWYFLCTRKIVSTLLYNQCMPASIGVRVDTCEISSWREVNTFLFVLLL